MFWNILKTMQKALKETYNLLNKDGILILEVPAVKFLYDGYDKQLMHFRRDII